MEEESRGKVIIQCLPEPCGLFRYTVFLFNSGRKKVYQGLTSDEGTVEVPIHTHDEYEVAIKAPKCMCPKRISRWVELNPRSTCDLCFVFNTDPFLPDSRKITFHLTDKNYAGLPISEGELHLCQDLM